MIHPSTSTADLSVLVARARQTSLDLVADLTDEQLAVPLLPTVNPFLWELCHVAYFQEFWVLRQGAGQPPADPAFDELFDSALVEHESRWSLAMPARDDAVAYVQEVCDRVQRLVADGDALDDRLRYLLAYSLAHEAMHGEAFTYTRQALGYPAPRFSLEHAGSELESVWPHGSRSGMSEDVALPGGVFLLGASRDAGFVHDNEKWAHGVELAPYRISSRAVTQGEFAAFVEDDGYRRRQLWSDEGWKWVLASGVVKPVYWIAGEQGWLRRDFDVWVELEPGHAMSHVNWYEAEAYCRWAGRRLPTEAEWEAAACGWRGASGGKPSFPWGDAPADGARANLGWVAMGTADVDSFAAGDAPGGCRQMIGNVWEWTDSTFEPYPGFVTDMYVQYSTTSFHHRKTLRGGSWATAPGIMRNTFRNFFQPCRRDIFAGFRTCALEHD